MRTPYLLGVLLAIAMPAAQAADPPADATFSPNASEQTLAPRVVVNSGHLEWLPYKRDLTPWVTLSEMDKRPASQPKRIMLTLPLNGDANHGRHLTREWCVVCHKLPGDDWPGTIGIELSHYGQFHNDDAKIFQQIFDARIYNPNTVMPPFGTHGLLKQQDIRDLVAYLQSLR